MLRRSWLVLVGVLAVASIGGEPAWAQQPGDPPAEELPTVEVEPIVEPIDEGAQPAAEQAVQPAAEDAARPGADAELPAAVEAEPDETGAAAGAIQWGGAEETAEEAAAEAAALAENAGDDVPGDMTTEQAQADPAAYALHLREVIKAVKTSVMARLETQVADKQAAKLGAIFKVLFLVSFGGILLLLLPLFLIKRYPGQGGTLFKYSAMAALTAFVAINLFALVLLFLRTTQGQMSSFTNPKLAIISASFDTLDDMAADEGQQELLATLGPQFIEPMLERLSGDTDDDLPVVMMQSMAASPLVANIEQLHNDIGVFETVASFFKSISWVFAMVPIVLTLLAVALFLVAIKPTLMEIVQMPARAAQGQQHLGARMTRLVFSRVAREFAATLCLIGVLFVVVMASSALLYQTVKPAVEALLGYIMVAFMYLLSKESASSGLILFCLITVMLFLVLNLAVMILGSAFFLGKTQKIFQQRFQDRIPLGAHRRFWIRGVASVVWIQVFPLLFILAAEPLVGWLIEKFMGDGEGSVGWGKVMILAPLILVLGFVVLFWAARGLKGLTFLMKYRPKEVAARLAAASAAYPQPGFAAPYYPAPMQPQPGMMPPHAPPPFGPGPLPPPPPGGPYGPGGGQSF